MHRFIAFERRVLTEDSRGLKLAKPMIAVLITITSDSGVQSYLLPGNCIGDVVTHLTSAAGLHDLPGLHYAELSGLPTPAQGAL